MTIADFHYIDVLVQGCSISIANAMEILQSCTKPWHIIYEEYLDHSTWL